MTREDRLDAPLRALARIVCIAFGLFAIVASGGGSIGFPDTTPTVGPLPPTPYVSILPGEPTVQAGTVVRFDTVTTNMVAPIQYQWRRDGVEIAGATGAYYVLGGAQAGDDGARFQVVAASASGLATSVALLHVSPLPPVVFEDTDFPLAEWTVSATPSSNNPSVTASQSTTAGNPGPSRLLVHQLPADGSPSGPAVHG